MTKIKLLLTVLFIFQFINSSYSQTKEPCYIEIIISHPLYSRCVHYIDLETNFLITKCEYLQEDSIICMTSKKLDGCKNILFAKEANKYADYYRENFTDGLFVKIIVFYSDETNKTIIVNTMNPDPRNDSQEMKNIREFIKDIDHCRCL